MTECREDLRTPWGKAFTVIALLLLFFCVSGAWANCISASDWNSRQDCSQMGNEHVCGGNTCYLGYCNCTSESKVCDWGSKGYEFLAPCQIIPLFCRFG